LFWLGKIGMSYWALLANIIEEDFEGIWVSTLNLVLIVVSGRASVMLFSVVLVIHVNVFCQYLYCSISVMSLDKGLNHLFTLLYVFPLGELVILYCSSVFVHAMPSNRAMIHFGKHLFHA